jgi:putative transposase
MPSIPGLHMGATRMNRQCIVKLKPLDRTALQKLLAGGSESVRVVKRAMALLKMDGGTSPNKAAAALDMSPETCRMIGYRYMDHGLATALAERPRPGNPALLNERQKKQLIAIACSSPPNGKARWSTALLAEELIKRKIIPYISKETVRVYLHSSDLKPWREKNVVHSRRVRP